MKMIQYLDGVTNQWMERLDLDRFHDTSVSKNEIKYVEITCKWSTMAKLLNKFKLFSREDSFY